MYRNYDNPNIIVIVAFAMLLFIVPVAGAFSGMGGTATESSMGSLGQGNQATQGLQSTQQNVTEPSSVLETPSSPGQSESVSDGNPPLPTPDLSQQNLSEQAGSIKQQPPQPTRVLPPLIDQSERSGTRPSSSSK